MKKYVKLEIEITEFDVEDVIMTSGPWSGEEGDSTKEITQNTVDL